MSEAAEDDGRHRHMVEVEWRGHVPHFHLDRHKTYHRTVWAGHMSYFGAAFVEAHGMYAYAAGTLFVLGVVGLLMREEGP